jgi:hypothetical protein
MTFIEDQAFSPSYNLAPSPPLPSVSSTGRKTEEERQLSARRKGKEVGEKTNHTAARKDGPL